MAEGNIRFELSNASYSLSFLKFLRFAVLILKAAAKEIRYLYIN
jgi:hypothetical protein